MNAALGEMVSRWFEHVQHHCKPAYSPYYTEQNEITSQTS